MAKERGEDLGRFGYTSRSILNSLGMKIVGELWIWVNIQFLGVKMVLQENGLRRNIMRHLAKHHDISSLLSNAQDKKQRTLIYPQHGEAQGEPPQGEQRGL